MNNKPLKLLPQFQSGFSLIEISIVLLVVGLLISGIMHPLGVQIEKSRRNETRQTAAQALEAVYGYTLANGRLPCPDTTANGLENRTGNNCTRVRGTLPWATLGLAQQDAWGQPYIYRVTNSFADLVDGTGCGTPTLNISFSLCSTGDIQILNQAGGTPVAINIPAVIVSRGQNFGLAPAADERENSDNDAIFVDKIYTSVVGSEYDDIVSWVIPGVLVNRSVNAGLLP